MTVRDLQKKYIIMDYNALLYFTRLQNKLFLN